MKNKAPIVIPDINDLGDKRLSPAEGLAKATEETNKFVQRVNPKNLDTFTDRGAALGRKIHANELIRSIEKLNPLVLVVPGGIPGHLAVRYPGLQYVTGFPHTYLPEYSAIVTDDRGVATFEVRGWREVVKALIARGAFTLEAANKEFGIALGSRAERWEGVTKMNTKRSINV